MIESPKFYQGVSALCLQRIMDAYDPSTSLFTRQLRDREWAPTLGTEDMTSTAICLLGLIRAGLVSAVGIDVSTVLTALMEISKSHNYPGGIGLVIWANAVADGMELRNLLAQVGWPDLELTQFICRLTTMESSWLLSGLLHEYKRLPAESTRNSLSIVIAEIINRFDVKASLFHHATSKSSIKDRLRKHIANFADQIYSVQALSYAAILLSHEASLDIARHCALRLIDLQGGLGQWWWHYNSISGRVAQSFPVYAVHQHAMAPMALMALTVANGGDFTDVISLSQQWLSHNELGVNLVDLPSGTIWRDIGLKGNYLNKYIGQALELLGFNQGGTEGVCHDMLTVNFETRPYEWAWCLFAGAMSDNSHPPLSFVA